MADIKNPTLLYAKGALFVLGGVMAVILILAEHPSLKVAPGQRRSDAMRQWTFRLWAIVVFAVLFARAGLAADSQKPINVLFLVDASTLRGKVMCGYQGWFRCPGDGSELGWVHWSHSTAI